MKMFLSQLDSPLGAMQLVTDAEQKHEAKPARESYEALVRTVAAWYLWRLPSR